MKNVFVRIAVCRIDDLTDFIGIIGIGKDENRPKMVEQNGDRTTKHTEFFKKTHLINYPKTNMAESDGRI